MGAEGKSAQWTFRTHQGSRMMQAVSPDTVDECRWRLGRKPRVPSRPLRLVPLSIFRIPARACMYDSVRGILRVVAESSTKWFSSGFSTS